MEEVKRRIGKMGVKFFGGREKVEITYPLYTDDLVLCGEPEEHLERKDLYVRAL